MTYFHEIEGCKISSSSTGRGTLKKVLVLYISSGHKTRAKRNCICCPSEGMDEQDSSYLERKREREVKTKKKYSKAYHRRTKVFTRQLKQIS